MKTFVKLLLAAIGLGTVGYLVKREYDKNKKQQQEIEKEFEKELEESGIDRDSYEMEIDPEVDEDNLSKKVYLSLITSPVDIRNINVHSFIEVNDAENVIHLRTGFDEKGKSVFDFLLEIPDTIGDYKKPQIGDFIKYFRSDVKSELEKMTSLEVRTNLEGYYMVMYLDESGEELCTSVRIPKEHYESFVGGKSKDGLTNYIEKLDNDAAFRKSIKLDDPRFNNTRYIIVDTVLLFKLSMPRRSSTCPYGLTVKAVRDILKYMINEEKLCVPGQRECVPYPYIMVNAEDEGGYWSISHYYSYNKNKGIFIDWYDYSDVKL